MVETNDMAIFSAVVSTGSLTSAAKQMGLSPAVVSKRIKRLEDQLGVRLLQRTTRQISLTDAGRGYHSRIKNIITALQEAEAFLNTRSNSASGTIKISAPSGFGRAHIAPQIHKLLSANPKLSVNLILSDRFVDLVGEGYDVSIRVGSLEDSSLVARKLAPVRRVLCATQHYLEQYGVPQILDDLDQHLCLATHNQNVWKLEGPNGPLNYRVDSRFQTNSSEVVREAVLSGAGIALRSTWDVGYELSTGRLKVVLPGYTGSSRDGVYALYPTRNFLPLKVRVFIEFLAELYGPEPYWDAGLDKSSRLSGVFKSRNNK